MKPFHSVAIPHKDILEGKLNLDIYAADLWEVFKGRSSPEYQDIDEFFRRTYMTASLKSLIDKIEKQLNNNSGAPIIQLQTPFGGGKTHALIALYHLARKDKKNVVVIVGEKLNTSTDPAKCETLWGVIEKQLTGKKGEFSSTPISPGGEQVRGLLEKHTPLLILIDEIVPYLNSISAVKVGSNSNLASQTLSFLQILTNVISSLPNTVLVTTTTPSNPYDKSEEGALLLQTLKSIFSRREIIETPVQDTEIASVIRTRLFSKVDDKSRDELIEQVINYFEKENILPEGVLRNEFKNQFKDSYPFLPDVINTLYHNWGSFTTFQRTRGVLRLLALVVNSLKDKNIPYITLSDFDLNKSSIRQEFLKHIESAFNSVIDSDITGVNSGSKKVDKLLGDSYRGYNIASRVATCIFLSSFSAGVGRGITLTDIKRNAADINIPSQVVSDAVEQMKTRLLFLQASNGKYYFSSQVNLWGLLISIMDNLRPDEISTEREKLTKEALTKVKKFKLYFFPSSSGDIPDDKNLKLIVLKKYDQSFINEIINNKTFISKRVYKNTLIFLCPKEEEIYNLEHSIKLEMAIKSIKKDTKILLSNEQNKSLDEKWNENKEQKYENLRRYYRVVILPSVQVVKELDLGIPTANEPIDYEKDILDILKKEGELVSKLDPYVLKEKYLNEASNPSGYVFTKQIYDASLTTPGEIRFESQSVLEESIREGVRRGYFGIGKKEENELKCEAFKEDFWKPDFSENEVLVSESLAKKLIKGPQGGGEGPPPEPKPPIGPETPIGPEPPPEQEKDDIKRKYGHLHLEFELPKGKASQIFNLVNFLHTKFNKIKISLICDNGFINENEYEQKVKETFEQLGIRLDKEKKEKDLFDYNE